MKITEKLYSSILFCLFFILLIAAGCDKKDKAITALTNNKEEVKKEISKKEDYKQIQLQELFKQDLPPDVYKRRYQEIIDQ